MGKRMPTRHSMRDVEALTRSEAALLDALRDTPDLGAAADALSISRSTAKTRLRTILDKLDAKDIAEALERHARRTAA